MVGDRHQTSPPCTKRGAEANCPDRGGVSTQLPRPKATENIPEDLDCQHLCS